MKNSITSIIIILISSLIVAISQCLLKISANKKYKNVIFEYLNPLVIISYTLLVLTLLLNIFAYREISYQLGPIIASSSYIFIMILGRLILKEKVTRKKLIGNIIIIIGIVISAM